ncbi:conserved virulence factor C family protein [Salibacterium qingdaonense]|uniref:PBS lyase HEAT-like repeat-containing protein n=1 Tax=Salibacterium qingdaonense TaxID=266892 RepID=A0A1I4JZX8_9BACI|nr:conserved virulence factor C family protein [Salibacterium qingdaonense]SFL72004.1 PBS lyase HEAT-like repeat-containing protein [Salibacterium qingdaonense]
MNIISIEPTPSPNTMKLIMDESLPSGKSNNYKADNKEEAPDFIRPILEIEGITGIYHVSDFMALERHPKAEWEGLLAQVRSIFGEDAETKETTMEMDDAFGEVQVQLQMFKDIPMQIKVTSGDEEKRKGLPERFQEAAFQAQTEDDNIVMQRRWEDHSRRYGDNLDDIAEEAAEETSAAYPKERLHTLVQLSLSGEENAREFEDRFIDVTPEMLDDPDWRSRYAALDKMNPKEKDLPVLEKALHDEKSSVRRLAVVYIGMIEKPIILPLLRQAMDDKSVTVRRTAADCFSDLGDPAGIPAMIEALNDKNKLVRWRAAMFLYEVGDETAIEPLRETANDSAFEVALQAGLALKRIEEGKQAEGSVWKQMTEKMQEDKMKE